MYYPSSEKKGADLRLCFRICVRLTTGPVPPNRPIPTNGPILTNGPIVSSFFTNGPIFPTTTTFKAGFLITRLI